MTRLQDLAPRVLVVDDDRLLREMARDALADLARVECCESAEAALEALDREPADLVLSDLVMPGLSGVQLLERVRREHPGSDVVLLTGYATVESAVGALRLGAADYLSKPLTRDALAVAVERILTRRRLEAENERLRSALRTVESCRTLVRCLDAGELYAVALDLVLHALGRERGLALFRRESLLRSDAMAFRGIGEHEANRLREVLVGEKPVALDRLADVEVATGGPFHAALRKAGLEPGPVLCVPIQGVEVECGALWLFEEGRPFDVGEVERAKLIAAHASLALQNAERYSQAKERAFIDDVTEVYNARYLLQAVEREIQRSDRSGREICILFLDLDRFKLVNDRHGHLVGSRVLRHLSRVLGDCIRQVDTLARYGGDEFTIVLVDTSLDEGMAVAERIRRAVADTVFEGGDGSPVRLTISIGASVYPASARDREALIDMADKAMYRAKSLGRNRVCPATELETPGTA